MAERIKPPMWTPGRNPDAMDLWRGCVACLPLWDSGDKAMDIGLHRNDMAFVGLEPGDWIPTEYGRGLSFDGSTDYGVISTPSLLPTVAEPRTVVYMMWAAAHPAATETVWEYGVEANNRHFGAILQTSGAMRYNIWGAGDLQGTIDVADGRWHTLCHTYGPGSYMGLYVDGQLDNSRSITLNTGSSSISFGRQQSVRWYFAGQMAFWALWNRAFTPGEVSEVSADPFAMVREPQWKYFGATDAAAPPAGATQRMFKETELGANLFGGLIHVG